MPLRRGRSRAAAPRARGEQCQRRAARLDPRASAAPLLRDRGLREPGAGRTHAQGGRGDRVGGGAARLAGGRPCAGARDSAHRPRPPRRHLRLRLPCRPRRAEADRDQHERRRPAAEHRPGSCRTRLLRGGRRAPRRSGGHRASRRCDRGRRRRADRPRRRRGGGKTGGGSGRARRDRDVPRRVPPRARRSPARARSDRGRRPGGTVPAPRVPALPGAFRRGRHRGRDRRPVRTRA